MVGKPASENQCRELGLESQSRKDSSVLPPLSPVIAHSFRRLAL